MNRIWILAAATGALAVSCGRGSRTQAKTETEQTPVVAVQRAVREDLSRQLELAAEFRAYQEIDVHAKVAGYLKEIRVEVGDRVKRGELLAVLEVPELTDDLERATAAVQRSNAELARARTELERFESAHAAAHASYVRLERVARIRPNLVAQQELDDALARDRVAEAQVSAGRAALAAAEHQVRVAKADEERVRTMLDYSRITAPFAGVITKRYADPGAMIQAGTASQTQAMPVVRLSQMDRLRLVAPVPESVAGRVHVGSPVQVRVPALNRTFVGRIARFSGNVEVATRTMPTEVDVANPELELMPGMYAWATLTLDRKPGALAVPVQAVFTREEKPHVLVVSPQGRIEERRVSLGVETPDKVEVLSGLREDELVVVGSRSQLRAGLRVEPREQP